MALKYQVEIDNFNLTGSCPQNASAPNGEQDAYRFSYAPIDNTLNFLPNVVFDRIRNIPYPYDPVKHPARCCARCSASYYVTENHARNKWKILSQKIRENLGYTHIAFGRLDNNDGVMHTPNNDGHFGFYESAEADLTQKFTLLSQL